MDVGAPLVADREATEAVEPGQGSLDNPAVSAQSLASFHASSCDARLDGAGAALLAATAVIVGLVRVELVRALPRSAAATTYTRHGVEGRSQHQTVVPVGRAQADPERRAPAVDHKMALRARFAAIRRVRTGFGSPLFADTDALSRLARLQSRCPASCKHSSSTR